MRDLASNHSGDAALLLITAAKKRDEHGESKDSGRTTAFISLGLRTAHDRRSGAAIAYAAVPARVDARGAKPARTARQGSHGGGVLLDRVFADNPEPMPELRGHNPVLYFNDAALAACKRFGIDLPRPIGTTTRAKLPSNLGTLLTIPTFAGLDSYEPSETHHDEEDKGAIEVQALRSLHVEARG